MRILRFLTLGALLATLPLALTLGCDKKTESETAEARDLTQKVAEAEKAENLAQGTAKAQKEALAKAGVQPDTAGVQLTEAQRGLLEARVKAEKNNGTAALLQEILDRDKQIAELDAKVAKLRADLPRPVVAKENDSHFALAVRYLKGRGLSEEKAKLAAARANLLEELQPGWQVYHQYVGGTYITAVTQGKAEVGPTEYLTNQRVALQKERDDNMQAAQRLTTQVEGLVAERAKIQEDVDALRTEKTGLLAQVSELSTLSQTQKMKLNAMHYLIGKRKDLENDGTIVVPVFAKDRMGPKALNAKFDKDLPLDVPNPEVVIQAADLGMDKISKVNVVPGSLEKGKHYTLTFSEDHKNATVRILDADRLRNDRVVLAVTD